MIPILDLTEQYRALRHEIDAAIQSVLESGVFIMGPNVEAFETEIAAYLGTRYAISLNSGTDALYLALRALGIGPGDEVITSPFTFIATTEAIGLVGAEPVFVDIDPTTFNIDADLIEQAITPHTRAVLPIHLYGRPARIDAVRLLAKQYDLAVIEDCAQAIGACVGTRKVGTIGDIGCFSFFPSKNLGAYGDGGLAVTNDPALADRLRTLRVHGGKQKYYHQELGVNSRLDELQAAILRVKLPHLDGWVKARNEIARRYTQAFTDWVGIATPQGVVGETHAYHQYTVRLKERDEIRKRLAAIGIQSMVYYPVPLHQQDVHKRRFEGASFPHSEEASQQVLSLPIFPELQSPVQLEVIKGVAAALNLETAV